MAAEDSNGNERFDRLEKSIAALSTLVENVSNSLHREIQESISDLRREMRDGFRGNLRISRG